MIRELSTKDEKDIYHIINLAAKCYKGVIADDCYHEPYMPQEDLHHEMRNMTFFGWEETGKLVAVMGLQPVQDVTLIRHAYVLPGYQRRGIGSGLLDHLRQTTRSNRLLVGTWKDSSWAINFYQQHGFKVMPDKDELLQKYWALPRRQIETSIVLEILLSS